MCAGRLVVFNTGTVWRRGDGRILLPRKTLEGVREFARRWATSMTFLATEKPAESTALDAAQGLGGVWVHASELPCDYVGVAAPFEWVRKLSSSDVLLAYLKSAHAPLLESPAKIVWTSELTLETRIRQSLTKKTPAMTRARIIAGAVREEARLRRLVRAGEGLQANGFPTWHAYRGLSASPMLFFDTRLSAALVPETVRVNTSSPMRLGFSGRHVPAKGPQHVVHLVERLTEQGHDVTLDVFGDGELRSTLEAVAHPNIHFHGVVDFLTEWVPFVRERIDLMILPHNQGDPSGTYLESAGLGVPVVAFDNEAFRGILKVADLGWSVRSGKPETLDDVVLNAWSSTAQRQAKALEGVKFMQQHSSDQEFERRCEHLQTVASGAPARG